MSGFYEFYVQIQNMNKQQKTELQYFMIKQSCNSLPKTEKQNKTNLFSY